MAILITGASAGFGAEMCRVMVRAGYQVIGAARRLEKLHQLQAELGTTFLPLHMDGADKQRVDNALASLQGTWADIDLLVNNAGLALGMEPAQEANYADWETMIHTNILGLTYVTRQ
ncbi:MAG: SDR family NAD(P)-dependent oxidoreductase, partial [Snodgrassella alvi]|nr:SDR family NAD(P)-dependent oxidoreductase [Snodgrassella alvi]